MSTEHRARQRAGPGVALASLLLLPLAVLAGADARADSNMKSPSPSPAPTIADPSAAERLIEPEDLARLLDDTTGRRPVVLHVGFEVLFRSAHIPGSRHVGPASTADGVAALKEALRKIPRQQPVVLYCGCCPWADCPNIRPALLAAREMDRRDVRLLHLPQNLKHDWVDKGLPISGGEEQPEAARPE